MLNQYRDAVKTSPLFRLSRKSKLAELIGIREQDLRYFVNYGDTLYRMKEKQKKDGKMRAIQDPERALKKAQASLARLLTRIEAPDFLFCPVKGRCYIENAAAHKGNRVVKTLDIKEYFPNTPSRRVYWFFREVMQCSRDVADAISRFSTYKGWLPTGSPLSPILSFYAHYDVWRRIASICKDAKCQLSVYIDDVTISGESVPEVVFWQVKREIHRAGHQYHKEKSFHGSPAVVTGVVIDGERLLVPNNQRKKLRKLKFSAKKAASDKETKCIEEKLRGMQAQVHQIRRKSVVLPSA